MQKKYGQIWNTAYLCPGALPVLAKILLSVGYIGLKRIGSWSRKVKFYTLVDSYWIGWVRKAYTFLAPAWIGIKKFLWGDSQKTVLRFESRRRKMTMWNTHLVLDEPEFIYWRYRTVGGNTYMLSSMVSRFACKMFEGSRRIFYVFSISIIFFWII